jgi:hypothetical protein
MFVGSDSEFVVEAMMPDLLHVIPVVDDTVLNGVAELKDSLLCLGFLPDIAIFVHADHDVLVFGSAHHRREGRSGGIISGKTSFAHSRSVVNYHRHSFLFTHNQSIYAQQIFNTYPNTLDFYIFPRLPTTPIDS